MVAFKVHILHVGNMDNKGTQALICSDVKVISDAEKDASISISTSDIHGVKKLGLNVVQVLPSMVDIPLRKADQVFKALNLKRRGAFYKIITLGSFMLMPLQIFFSLFSVLFAKIGLRPLYRRDVINRIKNSNLIVSHSDENFKETASLLPLNPYWALTWWSILISRTMDIIVARSFGKSVVLFPNSVGPFRTWIGRFFVRLALNSCDYLMIREPVSYPILDEVGVKTTKLLTYDTALLFSSRYIAPTPTFSNQAIGVCAGVYGNSLSKGEVERYVDAHARALDDAIKLHNLDVIFLPHYITGLSGDDFEISKTIFEKMVYKSHAKILCYDDVDDFKSALEKMALVISSKMHPAILAVTGYVPVLCIAYDHKQTAFFNRLAMDECLINIRHISYEILSYKINYLWLRRISYGNSLRLQIPYWQQNVRKTIIKVLQKYFN
jgi:polysaccharide pyruvyl transferase WcaK-like protein